MRSVIRIGLLSFFLVISLNITGCNSSEKEDAESLINANSDESQTPGTTKVRFYYKDSAEKRLVQLEQQLKATYSSQGEALYYQYNYADLNEDFSNEIIVWLSKFTSGTQKQTTHQFLIMDEQFKTIYQSENVKVPISVLVQKTNGWFDLAYFEGKGQYKIIKTDADGNYHIENSNENVIEFDQLVGVCYLSNAINEIGFQIK